ncbi:casein kinase 2 regulatory subunit [Perkinsus olseni]|uniref:Casein kinase II subunit beta n=1 Tax=Perkinsus olseni TaxID=32597 RepID=A0A7J6NU52_PEROL|nr:casein kinase 2 regulatory subunit [Perkinsus olseni]
MLQQMKIPIDSECGGKGECKQCTGGVRSILLRDRGGTCPAKPALSVSLVVHVSLDGFKFNLAGYCDFVHFDGVEGNSLACQTPAVAGMKLEVVPTKPQDTEPANLTEEVKEPGQIADFVIEQCEDWVGGSTDECLAVQYDLSGNARKFAAALKEKLGMKRIGQLMGDKAFIHVDAKDLTDMDALIIAKMLRFQNAECEMLDINNNPRMGDLGVKAIAEHVLGRASNGHPLETLLISEVNMTDEGLGYITEALKTNNKLRLLEMRKNKLTDEGVVALAKVLKDDNSTLESLYLNANPGLTDISAEVLADAVAARKGKLKNIEVVYSAVSLSPPHGVLLRDSGFITPPQFSVAPFYFTISMAQRDAAGGGVASMSKSDSEGLSDEASDDLSEDEGVSWIEWFCRCKGNEYFVEVDEDYVLDDFNLTGLRDIVPYYDHALNVILDAEDEELDSGQLDTSKEDAIESAAQMLYGLIHASGLSSPFGDVSLLYGWVVGSAMLDKYSAFTYGLCPNADCEEAKQPVLPYGNDRPGQCGTKVYCPRCNEIYFPRSARLEVIDGAYFASSFCHMFLMAYPHLRPTSPAVPFEPTVYGFKIHYSVRDGVRKQFKLRQQRLQEQQQQQQREEEEDLKAQQHAASV